MKNNTARLVSVLICLAMVLAVLPMAVFAASTTLYCDAPDAWEVCNVYAWIDGQEGAQNAGWPGVPMTKNDAGIWVAEVDSSYTHVIFNNGTLQSANLEMPTDDKVQYNYEGKAWSVYGAEVAPAEIEYYLRGTMNGWSTDNKMTKQADGTYSITMSLAAGSYEYKVGTDDWSWGCPAEGNQTLELAADASVTFVLNLTDNTLTATEGSAPVDPSEPADPSEPSEAPSDPSVAPSDPSVAPSEPSVAPSEPAATGVVVTATVPSDWTNVRIWAWNEQKGNAFGATATWPGTAMTKSGDKWTITLPVTFCDCLVINADVNGAVLQTKNVNIVAGKNVDVVVGSVISEGENSGKYDATASYNGSVVVGPVDPALKGVHRVVGNAAWMGEWNPASDAGKMTEISDGVYEVTFKNVPVGNYEFKITKDGTWDNAWGEGGKGGQANIPMVVSVAGDVTVRLNVGTGALSYKTAASGEWVPVTGDMGIAAVCAALLFASAGLVCAVSKKKEF